MNFKNSIPQDPKMAKMLRLLRRSASFIGRHMLITLAILITLVLFLYYLLPNERSVFLRSHTQFAQIKFLKSEAWILENARICLPRSQRVRQSQRTTIRDLYSKTICGEGREVHTGLSTIKWKIGTEIAVRRFGSEDLELRITETSDRLSDVAVRSKELTSLPKNSRIIIPSMSSASIGGLAFRGHLTLGKSAVGGRSPILLGGIYEFRELLPFRDDPDLVGEGKLELGDVATIIDRNSNPAMVEGFLSPPINSKVGFSVVGSIGETDKHSGWSLSRTGLAVSLTRHGLATTSVEPNWSDRALADEFSYALVAIFTFVITLLSVASYFRDAFQKNEDVIANKSSTTANGRPLASPEPSERLMALSEKADNEFINENAVQKPEPASLDDQIGDVGNKQESFS